MSVQINHIPGTAKGVDHAGARENKKLKIQGGLVGITRRENSGNNFFLILHVVSKIEKAPREVSHSQNKETKIHHALNQNEINIHSKNKDNVKRVDFLSIYGKGKQLNKKFIDERLRRKSSISIWDPLKKARLKGMKNSNTKAHSVTDGKSHQLERHCDLFRKIAVLNTVPGSNINIKKIIGNYECSSLARSLFDATGLPNYGGDGKSDLVHAVLNSLDGALIDP